LHYACAPPLAVLRLGVRAASAAHADIARRDRPRLLSRWIVEIGLDGRGSANQSLGDLGNSQSPASRKWRAKATARLARPHGRTSPTLDQTPCFRRIANADRVPASTSSGIRALTRLSRIAREMQVGRRRDRMRRLHRHGAPPALAFAARRRRRTNGPLRLRPVSEGPPVFQRIGLTAG